jgi:hypothetical protein
MLSQFRIKSLITFIIYILKLCTYYIIFITAL